MANESDLVKELESYLDRLKLATSNTQFRFFQESLIDFSKLHNINFSQELLPEETTFNKKIAKRFFFEDLNNFIKDVKSGRAKLLKDS